MTTIQTKDGTHSDGRFPMLMLVSMRGDFGEGNPWQFPMGQAVEPVLEAMGVIVIRIETPDEAEYYRHDGILQFVLRQLLA